MGAADPENIGAQPWMRAPETLAVMAALEVAGGADCARFVGGCVRNALSGHPVADIDIATQLTPDQVIAALKAARLKAVPTGVDHGTVTAVSGGKPFEITTLRRDVETDGRRAVVAFTEDWTEDALRRDFRLNAIYADAEGRLFDPTGEGVADARAGRIVFVGDAETRIREDALRILRFFRFQAWYGRGAPDAAALAACEALRDRLADLSAERVSRELLKLLAADDPRPAVRLMADAGILPLILPQMDQSVDRFERLVGIETDQLFQCDPLLRLASLLPRDPAVGLATAQRLRLSNAERDRLTAALGTEPRIVSWLSAREVRRLVYRLGAATFCDRVLLGWASVRRPATHQWRALLPMAQTWTRPVFPLGGEQAAAAGVPRGPLVGQVLREVEAWWVDHDFPADPLALIEQLKAVSQGMTS
jgi:poly(A) polymerase